MENSAHPHRKHIFFKRFLHNRKNGSIDRFNLSEILILHYHQMKAQSLIVEKKLKIMPTRLQISFSLHMTSSENYYWLWHLLNVGICNYS
jgi:hypothetical protein